MPPFLVLVLTLLVLAAGPASAQNSPFGPARGAPARNHPAAPATSAHPAAPAAPAGPSSPQDYSGIQNALQRLGLYDGPLSGVPDTPTIDSIRAFQRSEGNRDTGTLTAAELASLGHLSATVEKPPEMGTTDDLPQAPQFSSMPVGIGGSYTGDTMNGVPDGRGVWTDNRGNSYEGQFSNGQMEGYGSYTFANGDRYEGELVGGVFQGRGKLVASTGHTYNGEWRENRFHGRGVYVFPDHSRYEGTLQDGKIQGQGTLTLPDGRRFSGPFVNGRYVGTP
ncbi:exported hypothetical protein [uncultured Gammaproteobacteria bacterium]